MTRGLWLLSALALVALSVLVGLGTWQLERMAWKDDLLAKIAERTRAEPIAISDIRRLAGRGDDIEYLRVSVRGRYLHDHTRRLFEVGPGGPGWHVYTPLELAGGEILFVNRGYVPGRIEHADEVAIDEPQGSVRLVGLVRKAPKGKGLFTPDNDLAGNVWYWRDLDAMTRSIAAIGERDILPFFVDVEARPAGQAQWPAGGTTRLRLANRHFEYALTWYGLALGLCGVYGFFVIGRLKQGG